MIEQKAKQKLQLYLSRYRYISYINVYKVMYISDWAKFRYRNRKSTEESGNDLQKTLIFTPLTKRISRF